MLETFLAIVAALAVWEVYRTIIRWRMTQKSAQILEEFYEQQRQKQLNEKPVPTPPPPVIRPKQYLPKRPKPTNNPDNEEWTHLDR